MTRACFQIFIKNKFEENLFRDKMSRLLFDNFDVQNPLDYLDDHLKRKPRSSMEEHE